MSQVEDGKKCSEQDVLAATAMMIGGVAIGRALNDENTTKKLLGSCRQVAHDLLHLNDNN